MKSEKRKEPKSNCHPEAQNQERYDKREISGAYRSGVGHETPAPVDWIASGVRRTTAAIYKNIPRCHPELVSGSYGRER